MEYSNLSGEGEDGDDVRLPHQNQPSGSLVLASITSLHSFHTCQAGSSQRSKDRHAIASPPLPSLQTHGAVTVTCRLVHADDRSYTRRTSPMVNSFVSPSRRRLQRSSGECHD